MTDVERSEICSVAVVRRVAAMLDLDPEMAVEGASLPKGWHFPLIAADTRRSGLRPDGFPGLGVAMPDFGLPLLRLAGRTAEFGRDVEIGSNLDRVSAIRRIEERNREGGAFKIVTAGHELRRAGDAQPAVAETQTYALLPQSDGSRQNPRKSDRPDAAIATRTWTPDQTLLFQYSALCFNSHRIHIDRDYARDVEGFPDLVVNGGLTTLMLTEFARLELSLDLLRFKATYMTPLFCGRSVTIAAGRDEQAWRLTAHDEDGQLAAVMELEAR